MALKYHFFRNIMKTKLIRFNHKLKILFHCGCACLRQSPKYFGNFKQLTKVTVVSSTKLVYWKSLRYVEGINLPHTMVLKAWKYSKTRL